MMELLTLPNFYLNVIVVVTLLLLILIGITIFIFLYPRKYFSKFSDKDDVYSLSKALYPFRKDKVVREILDELRNYKYHKNPPSLPLPLLRQIKKIMAKKRIKSIQNKL